MVPGMRHQVQFQSCQLAAYGAKFLGNDGGLQVSATKRHDLLNRLRRIVAVPLGLLWGSFHDDDSGVVRSYVWGLNFFGTIDGVRGGGRLLCFTQHIGSDAVTHFAAYDGNGNVVGLVSATSGTETGRYDTGLSRSPFASPALRLP